MKKQINENNMNNLENVNWEYIESPTVLNSYLDLSCYYLLVNLMCVEKYYNTGETFPVSIKFLEKKTGFCTKKLIATLSALNRYEVIFIKRRKEKELLDIKINRLKFVEYDKYECRYNSEKPHPELEIHIDKYAVKNYKPSF